MNKEQKDKLWKHWRVISLYLVLFDVVSINFSYLFALLLRFDFKFSVIPEGYFRSYLYFTPMYTIVCIVIYYVLKLYRSIWRFAGFDELNRILGANLIVGAVHWVGITVIYRRMPLSYYVVGWLVQFSLCVLIRFSYRFINMERSKLAKKTNSGTKIMVIGAGAAGTAIARMLVNLGIKDILVCGRDGIICSSSPRLNDAKRDLLKVVNREDRSGSIHDAMEGADIFIGVSAPKLITADDVRKMADSPVVFAMSNPEPEIMPDEAARGGAAIIGTGRSDFNNQINNVLAFPGIFRGALDARAEQITEEMKVAAAYALAGFVSEEELCPEKILPNAFEEGIADAVAKAVADAWINRK